MEKANIALIGYGYWGKKIYKYLKKSEDFNLCQVYFPALKRLDTASIIQNYGSEFTPLLKDIWENKKISNVAIVTPIDTHYSLVREALLNSKNVFAEKPLTIKKEEIVLLKKIATEKKLKLQTDYTHTFSKALLHIQKRINQGSIGSIKSISITIKQLGRFTDDDVNTLIGSHALSILDMFISIKKCQFYSQPLLVTDNIITGNIIRFETENFGCSGYIDITLHCPEREKNIVIYGEKGTIIYNPYSQKTVQVFLFSCQRNCPSENLIDNSKDYHFDENHNLKYAFHEFYEIINNQKKDNIDRSMAVTDVLESLSNSTKTL